MTAFPRLDPVVKVIRPSAKETSEMIAFRSVPVSQIRMAEAPFRRCVRMFVVVFPLPYTVASNE